MYYTVISKSGWQTDFWKVRKTFEIKQVAHAYADKLRQRSDATQDHYNVQVKAHRKPLFHLLTSNDTIKFNDGTRAYAD